ncbi:Manganese/iron superoxide dismutase [Mycotypha africana]|uniref:Manganese/iron superoxide dismutase n=1 Tax=Mycotypha africana TaxID=64632 RepID=UPI0023011B7D|nr:Manganese/iron superoxide dismutase [Mycotypha africana]KAI8977220.1 Manganese/iron superoxide dismutase [Mycotypha africana]
MLSLAARSIKSSAFKTASLRPLTAIRTKVTLPDLPYKYDALEPYISGNIMEVHHAKHHQTYVNGFNAAEEKLENAFKSKDLTEQLALQNALKFNGGGHINHSLFWENLAPHGKGGGDLPKGALASEIEKQFGSFDDFKKKFNAAAVGVQGSGWAWLGYNKEAKRLEIATTPNQDPLLHLTPLLGVDVWEHAYYLQYKNVRPDYLNAIWNVINWEVVAERFSKTQ